MPKPAKPFRITSLDQAPATLEEALSLPGPTVIDLMPQSQRNKHAYFRGASLLAIIYNQTEHGILNTTNGSDGLELKRIKS